MKYERHIFICTNRRPDDDSRGCCASKGGEEIRAAFKTGVHERKLKSKVRANSAGCLDACEFGAAAVVYPEQVWYGGITLDDVDEIIDEHLVNGRPVRRLMIDHPRYTPPDVFEEST